MEKKTTCTFYKPRVSAIVLHVVTDAAVVDELRAEVRHLRPIKNTMATTTSGDEFSTFSMDRIARCVCFVLCIAAVKSSENRSDLSGADAGSSEGISSLRCCKGWPRPTELLEDTRYPKQPFPSWTKGWMSTTSAGDIASTDSYWAERAIENHPKRT